MNSEKLIVNSTKISLSKIFGAKDGARTRYLRLGKATLYQMSYFRIFIYSSNIIAKKYKEVKYRFERFSITP